MNVQTLVTHMMIALGAGEHLSKPVKKMKDLYLVFERDILAVAQMTNTNTGIVFAELLDAIAETQDALRQGVEKAREKLAAEEAAEEARRLAAEAERLAAEKAAAKAAARRRTPATTVKKKPGIGRKLATASAEPTGTGRRGPGRPRGSRNR